MHAVTTTGFLLTLTAATLAATPFAARAAAADAKVIDEITVTATRLERRMNDVAGTVTVISSKEIERELANDLDDLVRYQPGISMDTAGRGGNQGFIIRGIGGNRVLTLVDGVRSNDIYAAGPSSYGRDVFEVDDLEAVEVIRGPASVLYGADAMGGAVIMRTRDPADYLSPGERFYSRVGAGYADADEQVKGSLTAATRWDSAGAMIQYTARSFSEQETSGDVQRNPMDGSTDSLFLKGVLALGERQSLAATFDYYDEEIDYELLSDLGPAVTQSNGHDTTERMRFSMSYDWQADASLADDVNVTGYWQDMDALQHSDQVLTSYSFIDPMNPATYGGAEAGRVTDFEFNQEVAGLGLMTSKAVNLGSSAHTFVYGITADRTDTERPRDRCDTEVDTGATTCAIAAYPFAPPEEFPNKTFPDTGTTRYGAYVQDEIVLGASGWTIIPGVRYDRYEMDPSYEDLADVGQFGYEVVAVSEDEVTANLGVIYDVTDSVSFYAQYSEGFRPPNFDEANQAFVNYGFQYATVPNPDLEPETSQGFEIGFKAGTPASYLGLALFDNHYDDFINTAFVGVQDGISLFQDQNIGSARIYGAEATAVWQASDHWHLRAAVAYARGDDKESEVPLDAVDPLTGVIGLRFSPQSDHWSLESVFTLVDGKSRVSAPDVVTTSGYGLVDLLFNAQLGGRARLRLGVFNLTDREYARWANIAGLPADSSGAIALAQEPGTNVRAFLDFMF